MIEVNAASQSAMDGYSPSNIKNTTNKDYTRDFMCTHIQWSKKEMCEVKIWDTEFEKAELKTSKDHSKKSNKKYQDSNRQDLRMEEVLREVKHFDSPDQNSIYLFPYFSGEVSLVQVFIEKLEKSKRRGFFGLFKSKKSKKKDEETKEEEVEGFWYKEEKMWTYLSFLQRWTSKASLTKTLWIFSIYPRNIGSFLKFLIPKHQIIYKEGKNSL